MKNKISKTLFLIIPLLLLGSSVVFANDTYLGSVGGNTFNEDAIDNKFVNYVQSNNIQMVKERIHIDVYQDSFTAFCKFWFYNKGEKQYVFFGFPNISNSEFISTGRLNNFKTAINNKNISVDTATQVTKYGEDGQIVEESVSWYRWAYEMPVNDTLIIENTYSGEVGFSSIGAVVTYIIGTGSTWDGPIKDGIIVFDFNKTLSSNFIFKDTGTLYTKIKPIVYDDSIVFQFKNYKPGKNEYLKVDYLNYWNHFQPFAPSLIFKDNKSHGDAIKLMRNEIFARHGYVFKDANLNKYFSSKIWYKPNKNFKTSMLNKHEQAMVNYLSQLEKEVDK